MIKEPTTTPTPTTTTTTTTHHDIATEHLRRDYHYRNGYRKGKDGSREYQLIVLGASGRVGSAIVRFLLKREGGDGFSWAMAGRDVLKLLQLKSTFEGHFNHHDVDILEANAGFPSSLFQLAQKTEILVDCVPCEKYGSDVVEACIRARTHYLSLATDANFVADLSRKYNELAIESGILVLPTCGALEVLTDMGTFCGKSEIEPGPVCKSEIFVHLDSYSYKDILFGDCQHLTSIFSKNRPAYRGKEPPDGDIYSYGKQPFLKEWAIPYRHAAAEQIVYRTMDSTSSNSYFQCANYLIVPSFLLLLYYLLILGLAFLLFNFSITKNVINKFKHSDYTKTNNEDQLLWNPSLRGIQMTILVSGDLSSYISTSLDSDPSKTVVVQVESPYYLTYSQTNALMLSLCASHMLRHPGSLARGVLTPVTAFGENFLRVLRDNDFNFHISDAEDPPEEPDFPFEDYYNLTSDNDYNLTSDKDDQQ